MKNVRFVSPLALLCAILLLAFAPAASAITAPAVSIADSLGNTILVDGTGAVAYGGNCTPTTCTTSSVSVSTGQTTWAGTIGTFSLTAVIGTTKPYSVPNPSMDLNLQRVTTSSGGTLTIQWTDTDFNYSDIAAATIAAGGVLNGTGTSSYTAYFDNTNAPFGTGIQVGTLGPFPNGAFNGQVTGPGPTASPFSMTEVATVTLGPGGTFGVDYAFVPLPAPLSLKCSAASGQVGVPYNSSLMAIGGIVPYTFSIISGNLPSGLTLNPTTGAITGTPTQAGTFSFTAQVVDSSEGSADTVTSTCTIVITTPPPISLACPMSTGQVGVPYSSALTASGGVPPYTYSIQSGMLPNGLSLNPATGAITGTPTQAGPFSFVGQVIDSTNSAAGTTTSSCGITIASLPTANCVSITAVQGVAITPVTMTASGGTGTGYTFSATGLPSGLTMSSSGTISGTPTVSGTFPYTVTIKDSAGNTGTVNCSVTVAPPVTASCVSITAIQGVAITPVTMTASGGSGSGYTFSATGLPSGLTMSTGGTISGTPTVSGTFPYTVTVTDSAGNTGTVNCSVTVAPPVSASCVSITAVQGVAITPVTMTASGGTGSGYTFSATGLPSGLTMSSSGTISGTPTVSGTFPYTVTIKDSAGDVGTVNCSVTVAPPVTASCVSITAIQGVAITPVTMTASGGSGSGYTFSATGLPSGLTMSSSGTISGTPTVSGTFPYTVTIKDSAGDVGTVNCSVTVAPPVTANCVSITAIQGVAITPVTMTASGGTGSGYTFSATGLPSGLTMSSSGTISGTPTVSGTFPYTVTIKDSAGDVGTVNCSVTVAPPVTANCVSITAIQGVAITPVTMTASGGSGSGYTFSATGLPSGLTMSSSGTISGTPTVSGTFPYTVTIKDSAGDVGTVNCSVTVAPPVSASCVSITAVQGVAITPVTMTASGGTGSGYTFSATGLPSGLTMSSSGTISGTPTVSGTFPYTVTIKDSAGDVGTVNCSVTVAPPVTASCVSITAIQGVTITPVTLTAGGGVGGPYTFSSTDLPAGLSISTSGTISGTPAVSGTFTYHVTIRDRAGNIGIIACSVTVAPPPTNICGLTWGYWKNHVSAWKVTSLILGSQTYNQTQLINLLGLAVAGDASINLAHQLIAAKLNVANGTNPNTDGGAIAAADSILSTFSGYLPYNVSSSSTVGQQMVSIAGELDTFNSDGAGQPGCTNGPAPLTVTCASSSGQVGVAYSSSIVAGGGLAPYTFTIISGALPAGLTLNPSTGAITGTPTTAGTFSFKVEVADSTAVSGSTAGTATTNCSITIAPPPQPLQLSCPSGSAAQGTAYSSAAVATGGISPYTFSLVSGALPTGLTLNSSTGAVTGTPTKAGAYSFSLKVVDSKGSYAVSTCCSISVSGGITTGQFVTYTQGGWGAPPKGNNPGATMTNNFTKVYGSGGVVIGGTYKLTFTNALAITNFLPQGGTPGKLTASATDPGSSAAGVFAGQVLALQLSVDFSNKGITPTGLANLHVVAGPLAGDTVAQVLALANSVLGGGALPTGMAISDLNNVVDAINSNFDSGTSNNGYLQ